jgi:hypothetical protein
MTNTPTLGAIEPLAARRERVEDERGGSRDPMDRRGTRENFGHRQPTVFPTMQLAQLSVGPPEIFIYCAFVHNILWMEGC